MKPFPDLCIMITIIKIFFWHSNMKELLSENLLFLCWWHCNRTVADRNNVIILFNKYICVIKKKTNTAENAECLALIYTLLCKVDSSTGARQKVIFSTYKYMYSDFHWNSYWGGCHHCELKLKTPPTVKSQTIFGLQYPPR